MSSAAAEPSEAKHEPQRGAFGLAFSAGEFRVNSTPLFIRDASEPSSVATAVDSKSSAEAAPAPESNASVSGHSCAHALGTGHAVWECAVVLAKWIEHATGRASTRPDLAVDNCVFAADSHWRGLRVLELGSGTGLCGLALAAMGARVTLSDLPELLPTLCANAEQDARNRDAIAKADGSVRVCALDWREAAVQLRTLRGESRDSATASDAKTAAAHTKAQAAATDNDFALGFHYVLVADAVFNASAIEPLTSCLRAVCSRAPQPAGDDESSSGKRHEQCAVLLAHKSRHQEV